MNGIDKGERWCLGLQSGRKPIDVGSVPFDLDKDTLAVVADKAAEPNTLGQPIDKRPGKPTPCTTPVMTIRLRTRSDARFETE